MEEAIMKRLGFEKPQDEQSRPGPYHSIPILAVGGDNVRFRKYPPQSMDPPSQSCLGSG